MNEVPEDICWPERVVAGNVGEATESHQNNC